MELMTAEGVEALRRCADLLAAVSPAHKSSV